MLPVAVTASTSESLMFSNVPSGLDVRACIRVVIPTPFENEMVRKDFLYLSQYGFHLKMLVASAFYHLSHPHDGNQAFKEEINDVKSELNDIILDSIDNDFDHHDYIGLQLARHFFTNHGDVMDVLWRCYNYLIGRFSLVPNTPLAQGYIIGVEETPYSHQLIVYVQKEDQYA